MTVKTTLTNQNGQPIGYLETTGTVTKLTNINQQPLGSFDSQSNWTRNQNSQPVGQGNQLASLLPCPNRR